MTWKTWDWKFVATIAITIASLVIPLFIWQVDLSSRSITVRLVSTSPLQPAANIQNLQISINGQNIESPYLSTLELENTGSKPILTAEFDTPLEIFVKGGAKFISAEIANTAPKNIPVKISSLGQEASISPFLANPKDKITISVITSGPAPEFEPRARIAGINEVGYEDTSLKKTSYWRDAYNIAISCSLLFIYFIYLPNGLRSGGLKVSRGFAIFTAMASAFAALALTKPAFEFLNSLPYAGLLKFLATVALTIFVAFIALRYNRALRRKNLSAPS
ncbi:hypothetical protein [Pseudomonas frederiksbergensis]|uniref:hypothetical protein n=1 Tax=Pseudomonas frederiksbergensis TaxID=104087 RepID=UPI000F4A7319|nr:hypothetical protein [Pseudomonas frederiksbergensis]RON53466.1 hypothetical protein BK667_14385 [Pseudomonas frederiksbergensis]